MIVPIRPGVVVRIAKLEPLEPLSLSVVPDGWEDLENEIIREFRSLGSADPRPTWKKRRLW